MKKIVIFIVSVSVFFIASVSMAEFVIADMFMALSGEKKLPRVQVCNALEKRIVAKILKDGNVVGATVVNPRRCDTAEVPQFGKKRWVSEVTRLEVGTYTLVVSEKIAETGVKWKEIIREKFEVTEDTTEDFSFGVVP